MKDIEGLYAHWGTKVPVLLRVAVVAALILTGFLLGVIPAARQPSSPSHWARITVNGGGGAPCTTSGSRGGGSSSSGEAATGATGTLFSGAKQRSFTGQRLMSGSAVSGFPTTPTSSSTSTSTSISPQPGVSNKNWAVVTTINPPTEAILNVAALPGWSVVVVGDTSSAPFNLSAPNLVFLSADAQKQLAAPYADFVGMLPWKHFGRKNVGFLYAILQGAESVWDFDDDNTLKPGFSPQLPTQDVYQVKLLDKCPAFNPYPRMGGPSALDPVVPPSWPRGFPLDLIRSPCPHRLLPGNVSRVAVLQSLADHDPDVDAIFRLTRGVPFSFKANSRKTLVLPQGSLTPWNAQATLVLKPALWALLLPVTVHGRVSDIWRSYVAQRLLWDVGYSVAFAPPMVVQHRPAHNYLADMQAEADLYSKASQLVQFLGQWKGGQPTIAGRYEELMVELYERAYIDEQDVQLTQQWLKALIAGGYSFPELVVSSSNSSSALPQQQGLPQQQQPPQQQVPQLQQEQPAQEQQQLLQQAPSLNKGPNQTANSHSAWAVVLSRADSPSAAVKKLASLPGWQVVVVADLGSDSNSTSSKDAWKWPNVTYLDEDQQSLLPYAVLKHLPWNSYSRKVLGYLHAVSQGAKMVYDADDSVELLQDYIPMLSCDKTSPEVVRVTTDRSSACSGVLTTLSKPVNGPALFNPFPLFGQPHVCPRGIPPARVEHSNDSSVCFHRSAAKPVIHQGLINGRPDVDEGYHGSQSLDVVFERSGFSVVLPHGMATPVGSLNTLYLQEALWALLLPASARPEVGDIWRGLWAQRLLMDVGGHVAVLPPSTTRQTTVADQLMSHGGTAWQGTDTSQQAPSAEALWQDLTELKLKAKDLPGRMVELAGEMAKRNYLQPAGVTLVQAWIGDLRALRYAFPPLSTTPVADPPVVAAGPSNATAPVPAAWMTTDPFESTFIFPQRWCMQLNTVLVVNFNRIGDANLKKQMRLFHAVYRPWFRRVFMSGSEDNKWVQPDAQLQRLMDHGYFLNCGNHSLRVPDVGFYTYACATEGVMAGQKSVWRPDGDLETVNMFYINDDVIFSPCMEQKLNHSNIWFTSHLDDLAELGKMEGWHWDGDAGRTYTVRQTLAAALRTAWGVLAPRAAVKLEPLRVYVSQQGDTFYVPARYLQLFARAAVHFQSNYVMSEAAISNILGLVMDGPSDVELMTFAMAWGGARDCMHKNIDKVLPLGSDINQAAVRECGANFYSDAEHDKLPNMFSIHPVKMSDAPVASRWLTWWLSQDCTARQ